MNILGRLPIFGSICLYCTNPIQAASAQYWKTTKNVLLSHTPGTFGVLTLSVLLWPMYFITIPKDGVLGGIALGPDGRSVIALTG